MASNNRKMLCPYQPGQGCTFTLVFPWPQIYPPPQPPPPPPPPQRDISVFFSTSICITGAALLFLFLTVFLYFYITQTRRSSPSAAAVAPFSTTNRREDDNEDGDLSRYHHFWRLATPGLHRSAIDSITVIGFRKGEGIIDGTDCSVCLSEFEEDEALRLLPKCRHAFHVNCIDMWLLSHKNCPLCRAPVFSTEVRIKKTEMNHQTESGTSNAEEEEESSESRNINVLPRSQSDLARHCGGAGRFETVRRSFSIGGSSLVKAEGSSDDVAGRSRRQFYNSFSANFFSSSRRSRNQDPVLPTQMPPASG